MGTQSSENSGRTLAGDCCNQRHHSRVALCADYVRRRCGQAGRYMRMSAGGNQEDGCGLKRGRMGRGGGKGTANLG